MVMARASRSLRLALAALALLAACLTAFALLPASRMDEGKGESGRDLCAEQPATIVVNLREGQLTLCRDRHLVRQYRVASGSGGPGKREEGDNKTPVGSYAVGVPRRSAAFGTFIPIGYPTEAERAAGATGGDIGLHGPKRGIAWLGSAATRFNWTRGCLAVASDAEIDELAAWVRANRPARIHIE